MGRLSPDGYATAGDPAAKASSALSGIFTTKKSAAASQSVCTCFVSHLQIGTRYASNAVEVQFHKITRGIP
jgi:hypothetical protein